MVIEASGIDGRRRRPGANQCPTNDALDEANAAAQTSQYPRWRRRVGVVWLPGGPGKDMKRRTRTCVRTARLSALTHLAPTFGPEMGWTGVVCLGRAAGMPFTHFSVRTDAFEREVAVWIGPLEMP
jgi:hypothetical protein